MTEIMTNVLWRRLRYMLTPQFDLYHSLAPRMYDKYVMEVGFGTGFGTLQLARQARQIIAIEPDEDAVAFASQALPLKNVVWVKGSILDTPHVLGSFDVVVMVETLEHISEWELALENIYGYLKPKGLLYMTARNNQADLRRNDLHEREWTAKELKDNLCKWFDNVELYDYKMDKVLGEDTHITPLIAVAQK